MCATTIQSKYYIYRIKNPRFGIPEPLITRSLDKRQTQFKLPSLWIHTSRLQRLAWKSRSFFAGKSATKQQQIKRKILAVLLVSDGSGTYAKKSDFWFFKAYLGKIWGFKGNLNMAFFEKIFVYNINDFTKWSTLKYL